MIIDKKLFDELMSLARLTLVKPILDCNIGPVHTRLAAGGFGMSLTTMVWLLVHDRTWSVQEVADSRHLDILAYPRSLSNIQLNCKS